MDVFGRTRLVAIVRVSSKTRKDWEAMNTSDMIIAIAVLACYVVMVVVTYLSNHIGN